MDDKLKILYVDDEEINIALFEINFSTKYQVYTAANGANGLQVLEEYPDIPIIISDMKMPGMNGLEFIKAAKEKFPGKKFFILTGFNITSEIQNALSEKLILNYFQKPFNLVEIETAIDAVS